MNLKLFDEVYVHVYKLLKDLFNAYKSNVIIRTRVNLARADALWWTKRPLPTFKEFFSFPNPSESSLNYL